MQKTITGFKRKGTWSDIVEHGERITAALVQLDVTNNHFEEWNEWRPKADDRLRDDIKKKTAEKAAVNEGTGEQKGKSPDDDLVKAGKKLTDSGASSSPKEAAGEVQQSLSYAMRAVDTASRKLMRGVETSVYQHIMTKMSPYYFDNQLISANATRVTKLGTAKQEFVLEVNVSDDDLREDVEEVLDEFEDINRWHMETPKETENAENAEGQETPGKDTPLANSVAQVSEPKEEHKELPHNR